MYDLDKMLDEVRGKYYSSKTLPRPTISWSDTPITAFFGVYNLYNNHITVSKILNSKSISYEAVASVVYHESLHQDFAEHDTKFSLRANKFPNYKNLQCEIDEFAGKISESLEYSEALSAYGDGCKDIAYIVLPYTEDFIDAFCFYDGNIFVDCYPTLAKEKTFVVFLVDNGDKYHIVAWASEVSLCGEKKSVQHEKLGGKDFTYSAFAPRNSFRILFEQTCSYTVNKTSFPKSLQKMHYCVLSKECEDCKYDLEYMNSYPEGFYELGLDISTVNVAAPYLSMSYIDCRNIVNEEYGFRKLWASNSLCEIEKNSESLYLKAIALRQSSMVTLSHDVFKQALKLSDDEDYLLEEMVISCALVNDITLGKKLIQKLTNPCKSNYYLMESIRYIKNQK